MNGVPAAVHAALVDLDGTLLDTVPDIAAAVNRMLAALGLRECSEHAVRNLVGQGSARLVERCLALDGAAGRSFDRDPLELFVRFYDEESGVRTRSFPGVIEGLGAIAAQGVRLACVTNKLTRFTVPLLERTGLAHFFAAVVCGDSVARLKPDPLPMLHACRLLAVEPAEAIVIGDSANDVAAARAAGCRVLCVPYGYSEGQSVSSLGCDCVVDDLCGAARFIAEQDAQGRAERRGTPGITADSRVKGTNP